MRLFTALVVCVLVTTFFPPVSSAEDRFHDFGNVSDFNEQNEIHFPKPEVNKWLWGINNPEKFIQYETADDFWWVTAPGNKSEVIAARVIKSYRYGIFRVREISWGANLHLGIRFKDNLLAPVSIWVQTGEGWRQIGEMGGFFDHKWKTARFVFDYKTAKSNQGWFEFGIGRGGASDLIGDLPVDWIRLANEEFLAAPEKDGFWPAVPPTKFADIGRSMVYKIGHRPRFVVGPMVKAMREQSWRKFAGAGCNHIDLQAWQMNWKRGWEIYSDGTYDDRVRYGFADWNEACAEAGISCSVQFFTDTRARWIQGRYKKESEMLRTMEDIIGLNRKAKANLAWFPIDEPDHDDPERGAPLEFTMQVTQRIRKADPDKPVVFLFEAEKPRVYEYYRDAYDVAVFNAYPLAQKQPVTLIADKIDEMRRQLGDTKALWATVEGQFGRNARKLSAAEILLQGYLAITHGIQGVLFYLDYEGQFLDMSIIPQAWAGMRQFASEITSEEKGIESFLVAPAQIVDIMGSSGKIKAPDVLHYTLRRRSDGKYAFIVVNTAAQPFQAARMNIERLPALRDIEVRFENRSLSSLDGRITDDFAAYERHVYIFEME